MKFVLPFVLLFSAGSISSATPGEAQDALALNPHGTWSEMQSQATVAPSFRLVKAASELGRCYATGPCFVPWMDNVTKSQCRGYGGSSWASLTKGVCEYPLTP